MKLEKSKKEIADTFSEKNTLSKENHKLDQKVQEKENEIKTMKFEAKDSKIVIENFKSDAKIANKATQLSNKEITRLQLKNSNLEDSVNNKKVENKKLKDENKKLTSENLNLDKKLSVAKQQEKKVRATTLEKTPITMSTTPLLTNPLIFCSKDTHTDKNLIMVPFSQSMSVSATSSQSLQSSSPPLPA